MATAYREYQEGVTIDAHQLKDLGRALRAFDRPASNALRRKMRDLGKDVAQDARGIVAPHSKTIPDTIKVRTRGMNIVLQAGSDENPLGRLFELGNRDSPSLGDTGTFRHPVFANADKEPRDKWTWTDQRRWAFLRPAAQQNADHVSEGLADAFESAMRDIGIVDD